VIELPVRGWPVGVLLQRGRPNEEGGKPHPCGKKMERNKNSHDCKIPKCRPKVEARRIVEVGQHMPEKREEGYGFGEKAA